MASSNEELPGIHSSGTLGALQIISLLFLLWWLSVMVITRCCCAAKQPINILL